MYKLDFKIAIDYVKDGDYGAACAEALVILYAATLEGKNFEAQLARQLISEIERRIQKEFGELAKKLGLRVSPGNIHFLMREHSPHIVNLLRIMEKTHSEDGIRELIEEYKARIYPYRYDPEFK